MKKNDLAELRKLKIASLQTKLIELKKKLVLTKLKIKRGEMANLRAAKQLRRDIAILLTLIKEKELIASLKQIKETK